MPQLPNLKKEIVYVAGWATGHVVAACAICAVIGFVIGAVLA